MSSEMTIAEQTRRDEIENEIDAQLGVGRMAYLRVGKLLAEILDSRLYRNEYGSFEDYCNDFWGFSEKLCRTWADAWRVSQNLTNDDHKMALFTWNTLEGFSPAHARCLARIPADVQLEAWTAAKAVTETPTVKLVKEIADKYAEKEQYSAMMTADEEMTYLTEMEKDTSSVYWRSKAFAYAVNAKRAAVRLKNACDDHFEHHAAVTAALDTFIETLDMIKPPDAVMA